MSNNTHGLKIQASPYNSRVWVYNCAGYFVRYYTVSPSGAVNKLDTIVDSPFGVISQSKKLDPYKNRDCYHHYLDFTANLTLSQIPGVTTTSVRNPGSPAWLNYYQSGSLLLTEVISGAGATDSYGQYWVTNIISADEVRMDYYREGKISNKNTWKLLSYSPPKYIGGQCTYVYEITIKFESWYKNKYPSSSSDQYIRNTVSPYPSFFGYTTKSVPSKSELVNDVSRWYSEKYLDHYIPESFTDDLFDKLTIPGVNNIENLKDLKDFKKSIPPIVNLLKRRNFKSFAEFYLWYKYTYRTTKMDLTAYLKFFQKWYTDSIMSSNERLLSLTYVNKEDPAVGVSRIITTRYNIRTTTYSAGVLECLGLDINLSNTWDLVPFSFVVDWFINFGDILSRIDHEGVTSKLHLKTCVASTKRVTTYQPLLHLGCTSTCIAVDYQRNVLNYLPVGNISFSTKDPSKYISEGLALIVANKR